MTEEFKEISIEELRGISKERIHEVESKALELTRFPEGDEDVVKFKKLVKYIIDAESDREELERLKNEEVVKGGSKGTGNLAVGVNLDISKIERTLSDLSKIKERRR